MGAPCAMPASQSNNSIHAMLVMAVEMDTHNQTLVRTSIYMCRAPDFRTLCIIGKNSRISTFYQHLLSVASVMGSSLLVLHQSSHARYKFGVIEKGNDSLVPAVGPNSFTTIKVASIQGRQVSGDMQPLLKGHCIEPFCETPTATLDSQLRSSSYCKAFNRRRSE